MGLKRRLDLLVELAKFFHAKHVVGFEPPTRPLLDTATAEWIEKQLQSTRLYLEYGSGGTTILANRLGVRTISVESDAHYAAIVRNALQNDATTKILSPEIGLTGPWGTPLFFRKSKGARYITAPFDRFRMTYPDLIFVDGRYRVGCVLACANIFRAAGARAKLLFDDYMLRPHYHVVEPYLGPPERIGRAALFTIGDSEIADEVVREYAKDYR